MPTTFLSPTELSLLSGYARPGKQAEWLANKGIPHQVDGRRVIASHAHVQNWLEGHCQGFSAGPNWSTVK